MSIKKQFYISEKANECFTKLMEKNLLTSGSQYFTKLIVDEYQRAFTNTNQTHEETQTTTE